MLEWNTELRCGKMPLRIDPIISFVPFSIITSDNIIKKKELFMLKIKAYSVSYPAKDHN